MYKGFEQSEVRTWLITCLDRALMASDVCERDDFSAKVLRTAPDVCGSTCETNQTCQRPLGLSCRHCVWSMISVYSFPSYRLVFSGSSRCSSWPAVTKTFFGWNRQFRKILTKNILVTAFSFQWKKKWMDCKNSRKSPWDTHYQFSMKTLLSKKEGKTLDRFL